MMEKKRYKMTARRRAIAIRFVRRYPALLQRRSEADEQEEKILCAVEKALGKIQPEYRNRVLDSILFGVSRYDMEKQYNAGEATWQRQRERFLFHVAVYAKIR